MQTWHSISNGGGVRITTSRWLTAGEQWVHQAGLTPDLFVSIPESEEGSGVEDTQLQAAIDFLLDQHSSHGFTNDEG